MIVVEGIDGSGKSTQLRLLQQWLGSLGHDCHFTVWNSSALVRKATRRGKKLEALTPTTFSLLHATDFADRHETSVLPPLRAGLIVLADRYAYTAFARDAARGVDRGWVRGVYSFATRPDLVLYFKVPIEVSIQRLLTVRNKMKYYEAGMDLKLAHDTVESFRIFQSRVLEEYDSMSSEFGLTVVDASQTIPLQQARVRQIVRERIGLVQSGRAEQNGPGSRP